MANAIALLFIKDYSSSAASSASSSEARAAIFSSGFSRSSFIERLTLFLSKSISVILALISSPTLRTSAGVLILSQLIWLMWIRPSIPGITFANAPNAARPTTVASMSVPTG